MSRFYVTTSAVKDFLSIFRSRRVSSDEARRLLEASTDRARLVRTKANGAQVYRAARTDSLSGDDRHYLLVCAPQKPGGKPVVVAVGPPSAAHDLPDSAVSGKPLKPGEYRYWWIDSPGDLAERTETDPPSPARAHVHPLVAQLRDIAARGGLTGLQVVRLWGGRDRRTWQRVVSGRIDVGKDNWKEQLENAIRKLGQEPVRTPDNPTRATSARRYNGSRSSPLMVARQSTGLSRRVVAEVAGVNPREMRRWEESGRGGDHLLRILLHVAKVAQLACHPLRAREGFTQEEAAWHDGCHRVTWSRREREETQRALLVLRQVWDQQGVEEDRLE